MAETVLKLFAVGDTQLALNASLANGNRVLMFIVKSLHLNVVYLQVLGCYRKSPALHGALDKPLPNGFSAFYRQQFTAGTISTGWVDNHFEAIAVMIEEIIRYGFALHLPILAIDGVCRRAISQ